MTKIPLRALKQQIEKAEKSNVAKSTRRFFFNHLFDSTEHRGYFHVDQMYGTGSGVLMRMYDHFFVLTAKHVIDNNINGSFQNESPFWCLVNSSGAWASQFDFLYPKRIWNIGELISREVSDVDQSDICLIELFYPQPINIMPDHFIEIKDKKSVLTESEFSHGQTLLITGFPFEKNTFDFTPVSEDITHTTKIQRHSIRGKLLINENSRHISFSITDSDIQHENVNGMSGGAVYNVKRKANQVKLAGIPVTAGNNICRFIPSYIFIDAMLHFKDASNIVVDPRADAPPSLEDIMKFISINPHII